MMTEQLRARTRETAADVYARWREQAPERIACLTKVSDIPVDFHVELTGSAYGRAQVARFNFSGMSYLRGEDQRRAAPSDELIIQVVGAGGLVGDFAGREVTAGEGASVVFDTDRSFSHTSRDGAGYAFSVPRDLLGAAADTMHGAVASGARHRLLADYAQQLLAPHGPLTATDVARAEAGVAAVVRAGFAPGRIDDEAAAVVAPLALRRAQHFIADAPERPLDVTAVAKAAGVSRSTLYRLYAPLGGVMAQVWAARLDLALRKLSTPEERGAVADIAAACGFTSSSHFHARFRERFGFTPRNLRPF